MATIITNQRVQLHYCDQQSKHYTAWLRLLSAFNKECDWLLARKHKEVARNALADFYSKLGRVEQHDTLILVYASLRTRTLKLCDKERVITTDISLDRTDKRFVARISSHNRDWYASRPSWSQFTGASSTAIIVTIGEGRRLKIDEEYNWAFAVPRKWLELPPSYVLQVVKELKRAKEYVEREIDIQEGRPPKEIALQLDWRRDIAKCSQYSIERNSLRAALQRYNLRALPTNVMSEIMAYIVIRSIEKQDGQVSKKALIQKFLEVAEGDPLLLVGSDS